MVVKFSRGRCDQDALSTAGPAVNMASGEVDCNVEVSSPQFTHDGSFEFPVCSLIAVIAPLHHFCKETTAYRAKP